MTKKVKLNLSEDFAQFFESPSRPMLRELLRNQTGEYDYLDFKEIWPEKSELAKDILAFANTENSCLIIGVAEEESGTLDPIGLKTIEDKTNIKDSIKKYLPPTLQYEIHDFKYTDSEYQKLKGKYFQVLFVPFDPSSIPYLSLAEGSNIKRNRIYTRINNASTEADYFKVQNIIEKRLQEERKTPKSRELIIHLSDLEALYDHSGSYIELYINNPILNNKSELRSYIRKLIAKKKTVIEQIIES